MAVALQYGVFIVRISTINQKYPGGWQACLKDHAQYLGGSVWHDNYLFLHSSMSLEEIDYILPKKWEKLGFTPTRQVDGVTVCHDCYIESGSSSKQYPCDWIEFYESEDGVAIHLKGTEPGKIFSSVPGMARLAQRVADRESING
jgi:hypothetical protein